MAEDVLPSRVRALAEVIGLPAALKLVELRGGGRLYVPKHAEAEHWLALEIGLDALQALAAMYGGETIEIDRCHGVSIKLKHQAILSAADAGQTTFELARAWKMTERGIRLVKQKAGQGKPDPTLDLFTFFS